MGMKNDNTEYASADEAEAAFYEAFRRCDLEAMQTLWTEDAVCVHPGAEPILGRPAVLRSWEHIFSEAEPPLIRTRLSRRIAGDGLEVHLLEEHIGSPATPWQAAVALASNVYRHVGQGWLMVSHHASVMPVRQPQEHTLQ